MGAASMIIIALIVAFVNRGKIRSSVYERSRRMVCVATLLLGIHNTIQFCGHFREESVTLCWAINLAFFVVITPIYNMSELNLLRAGQSMKGRYIYNLLFIAVCYAIFAVGLATGTLINDAAPWQTATFAVAVCYSVKLLELSRTLTHDMMLTAKRLTDDELDEPHQALHYTAKSMNWLILLSLITPWVGMSASILLNSIFGLVMFGVIIWYIIKFALFGNNTAVLIEVTDEITEAVMLESEKEDEGSEEDAGQLLADDVKARVELWVAARHFIDANITIKDALGQMGITATALNDYLRDNTSVRGYRQWLPYLRIEEAKRLMQKHPEYSLQAIAEACGYANKSNFSRAFKAQEGTTPGQWLSAERKQKEK